MRKIFTLCFLLAGFVSVTAQQDLAGLKIFINPGHGGYDADDRNVVIAPFKQGDPKGFWESVANLDKGFYLRDYLQAQGATVYMSRVTNTSADDLGLSVISEMANANNVDLFYSIHSNAHNSQTNYPLMLFKGLDAAPAKPQDKVISDINWDNFYVQKITTWTYHNKNSRGDWSFYGNTSGLGVLRNLTVHGILSEGSFHDYIPETYRLMSPMYKKHESWMFLKTVYDYFQRGEMPKGAIAGDIRDSRNKLQVSYYRIAGRDEFVPIDKARITLLPNNITVETDTLYNGAYFFDELEPGNYQLKVEADEYYPKTVDVVVTKHKVAYENIVLDRVRSTPPAVEKYGPVSTDTEFAGCGASITLDFNWDMDDLSTTSAFSITPSVEGTFSFEDNNHRLVFTPSIPLEVSTKYTVKLDKSAKHRGDMAMTSDFTFSFTTDSRNRLTVLAAYPAVDDQNVFTSGEFRFVFDRRLNTSNESTAIRVVDKDGNILARTSRNTEVNSVSSPYGSSFFKLSKTLSENETYKIEIDGDLKDLDGIPVFDPIRYSFKTNIQKITDKTIADNFEGAAAYLYNATASNGVKSASTSRNTSTKLFDASSHALTYTFSDRAGAVAYKIATPTVEVQKDKVMGLHVYGDFSLNDLYLTFVGDDSSEYEAKAKTLDFLGWKFAEVVLSDLPAGKTVKFSGFKIKGNSSVVTETGTVYLDNLLVYNEASNIEEEVDAKEITIYPNPATEFVMVNLLNQNDLIALDLYTLEGRRVATSTTGELIVSDVAAGTYVLRVVTVNGTKGYPIIIVK